MYQKGQKLPEIGQISTKKSVGTQTPLIIPKCCCQNLAEKFGIKKFPCLNNIEETNSRSQTPVRKFRPETSLFWINLQNLCILTVVWCQVVLDVDLTFSMLEAYSVTRKYRLPRLQPLVVACSDRSYFNFNLSVVLLLNFTPISLL